MILGIDPSYTCTGLVLLTSSYKVVTSQKIKVPVGDSRMYRAGTALGTFIKRIHGGPGISGGIGIKKVVIEDAAYGAPSRITVAKLAALTGVYKYVIEAHDIDWIELSPSSAKKFITGKGTAEKWMVAREIQSRYQIWFPDDKGHDLSDAAALAIWGVHQVYGKVDWDGEIDEEETKDP